MTFFQRFKRYLFGIAIGVILTGVFFKDRGNLFTSWLPENVVLNSIKENRVDLSDKASCQFEYYRLQNSDIEALLEEGDVVFSESQVDRKPYVYSIYSENEKFNYQIQMNKELSVILEIKGEMSAPNCD